MMDKNTVLSGFYFTLEGGEGCGKTTIIKKFKYLCEEKHFITILNTLIEKFTKDDKYTYKKLTGSLFVREPGSTPLAQHLREIAVNNELKPWEEVTLFSLARTSLFKDKIFPALEDNQLVISDRGIDSSIVYQGIVKGHGILNTIVLNNLMIGKCCEYHFRYPDTTIILDLPPEVGLERIRVNNRETNKFDENDINFHNSVRDGFKYLATGGNKVIESSRFSIVDASVDEYTVFKRVVYLIINKILFLTDKTYLDMDDMNDLFKENFFVDFDEYTDIELSNVELDEWIKEREG